MPEQEVIFRLRVDAGQGAQGVERLEKATRATGTAATDAEQRFKRMNETAARLGSAGGIPGSPLTSAAVAAANRQFGIGQPGATISNGITPAAGAAAAGGGGIPGPFKAFLGLSAASAAVQGLGGGAQAAQDAASLGQTNPGQMFKTVFMTMLEGVPIVGQLAKGIRDLWNVFDGTAQKIAAITRDVEGAGVRESINRARVSAQSAGAQKIAALQLGVDDARMGTDAAQRFAAGLTPDVLASFRNDSMGEQRRAVLQAQAVAGAAGANVNIRQGAVTSAQATAQAARNRANAAQDEVASRIEDIAAGQMRGAGKAEMIDLRGKRVIAGEGASTALAEAQAANEAAQSRLTELQKAQTDAAQKELAAKQATVNLEKARVSILQQGAGAAGLAGPGELESILFAVKQAQGPGGFQSLIPEQRQLLLGNPTTADFARRQALELGERNPVQREIEQRVGQREAGDNRTVSQIADELERKAAAVVVEGARAYQEALEKSLTKLTNAITEGVTLAIDAAVNQIRQAAAQKALQEQIAGQQR